MGHLVLIGAGHAHMEVARQADRLVAAGLEVTLIDPGAFWYSGAATAMASGALEVNAARADPAALDRPITQIKARAVAIRPSERIVVLEDGRRVAFDFLSINTGSQVSPSALTQSGAITVKPVSNLAHVRAQVEAACGRMNIAVVGTGATGVEVALSLAALQRRLGAPVSTQLVGPGPLLAGWPKAAARMADVARVEAGVARVVARAARLEAGALVMEDGSQTPADLVVAATGLDAQLPEGLDAGAKGAPVGPDLSWIHDAAIFAAGDCAHMTHAPRPKLGVFGVRAAPTLINNLIQAAKGSPRRTRYDPQTRWLSIMDLGDRTGLARYGRWSHRSRAALALKRHIDARFVRRYQP